MLTKEQISDFERDGFLVIKALYNTDEMREITVWTEEVTSYPEVPGKYMMYFEQSKLDETDRILSRLENGCLEMAAGQHKQGLIGERWQPLDEDALNYVAVTTDPGDAIFFDSFAPHRSEPNLTEKARRVLYVTYNRLSEGDQRRQYYIDKRASYPPDCERDANKEYVFRV